ncbi:MAG TPA: Stk1 family PASTA domain-containing Ser/Thr kinase [Solirubrobacteraceae bacterium]|jgi:beta-lactam-binding protein with PASTA domain/predicted Ser/Thr protein kinase|nr:Stk1 family PASTA domain-containing Ser/Thr kinase [Solirubrobacteraceae bacterium]
MSARELAPDTVVDGRYSILSRIGAGGMAEVYCAQDLQLGRRVALKLLHRRFSEDPDFVERFRREASAAAGLQHPNVVGVFDRGEWDGTYYIAMEYLEGRSLKEIVSTEGPLSPARAIDIVVQILRAARFAHQRGVIHRDLKPHNVIVDDEGRAKVTDFGIARAGASDMTETGSIMGTAQYLSPEQAQGHAVSAKSDLYAIGILLYELLTARVPFEGDSPVTIALKQVSEAPVPPSAYNPAVPQELDAVVLRALEKDPAERFADADEFITALQSVRAGLTVPAGQSTAVFGALGAAYPATAPTDAAVAPVPPAAMTDDELAAAAYPAEPLTMEPEPPHDRRWVPWAVAAGIVAVVIGLIVLLLTLRPEKAPVPNVVGTQLDAASTVLHNRGFEVQVQRVLNPAPKDRVLREDPQPGTKVNEGSTIALTVSDGPGQAAVPDVSGRSEVQARRTLEKAGFKVEAQREPSDAVAAGQVTRTVPPGGSLADRGSTVKLYVSSGPGQVIVPTVVGQDQAGAQATLANSGLKVSAVSQESDQPAGTVLSQDPGAGTTINKGSTVTIVVAREANRVTVPGVVGEDEGSASSTLSAAGLGVSIADRSVGSPDKDGQVLAQRPQAGGRVSPGSTVTITVGRFSGSAPTPQPPSPSGR